MRTPQERDDCPPLEELRAYAAAELGAARALAVVEHLALCRRCRRVVVAYGTSESG